MHPVSFLVVSTGDRAERCAALLKSICDHPRYRLNGGLYLVLQAYDGDQFDLLDPYAHRVTGILRSSDRIGPHEARIAALRSWNRDSLTWVNLDDDMLLTDRTDYTSPIFRCHEAGVGFVSGNWGRTPDLAARKRLQDRYVKQPIVYTGGGMVYSNRTAMLMLMTIGDRPSMHFDDVEWSMAAYLHGHVNYRYLGSVAVHGIVSKGGRKGWIADVGRRPLPDDRTIRVDRAENGGVKIPRPENLTGLAHALHKHARAGLMSTTRGAK